MAKQPADVVVSDSGEPTTLNEFCSLLSQDDQRVELIAGFHHAQIAQGQIKATAVDFKNRFIAFANAPV